MYTDSENKFYYLTDAQTGNYKFESVDHSGKYLSIENGELRLGTSNVLFTPDPVDTSILAYYHDDTSDCYMAFDWQGVQHSSPCTLSNSHHETHLSLTIVV